MINGITANREGPDDDDDDDDDDDEYEFLPVATWAPTIPPYSASNPLDQLLFTPLSLKFQM